MVLATAAAVTALTTAAAAYLDAKLQLRHDLHVMCGQAAIGRAWQRAVRNRRTSMYYFLEKAAAAAPNAEAIWSRAGCFTRADTLANAHRYGQWFLAQGVRPGHLVAFFMINSPDFIFAWLGLLAIGAAPAMINYHLTGKALLHCLAISETQLVLVDGDEAAEGYIRDVRSELEARGVRIVTLRNIRTEVHARPATRPGDELRQDVQAGDPFALFYTSGTTGMPKACALPTVAGFGGASEMLNPVQEPDARFYDCMPYYHGTGGINALVQLLCGTTLCVAPRFSATGFWRDICDSRATWFVYVGETLRYLLAQPPSPLDRQHRVRSVLGNGLRPDVWNRAKERFGIEHVCEFFNSTEGMLGLENPSQNDFTALAVGRHGFLQRWRYHNRMVPVATDPETGDIVRDPRTGWALRMSYDVGGEILVNLDGSSRFFPGYWNNPEATNQRIATNVFCHGDRYFRTGDALRRDGDGRWFFLDRLGDTFRWKGENVSTAQVSEVLGEFPGVLEANVYGVPIPAHDGKVGVAALSIDPARQDTFDHRDLLRHARAHLHKHAVPLFLRHVAESSATHNNKQNKVPLKQEGIDPDKIKPQDKMFWIDKHGRGDTYVPFTRHDWNELQFGKPKL